MSDKTARQAYKECRKEKGLPTNPQKAKLYDWNLWREYHNWLMQINNNTAYIPNEPEREFIEELECALLMEHYRVPFAKNEDTELVTRILRQRIDIRDSVLLPESYSQIDTRLPIELVSKDEAQSIYNVINPDGGKNFNFILLPVSNELPNCRIPSDVAALYSGSIDIQEPEPNDDTFLSDDKWIDVDVSGDYLDFEEPYESPKYTLSYNGIAFAPLGGIHALTGQSGHGKTMLFTQYMAAILSGKYGGLCYELSDIIPRPSVLYIDTEMEKCNTIAVKNRVCELIGWNPQERRDDFTILMLRETTTAQERWQKVLRSIYEKRPTVVFIDGLLDVVNDFNSNEECQRLIYKCMQVASHYGISVWCLVHQNPNTTKLVGHLGSMLERKVTDVFTSKKDTDERTGEVTFTVWQTKARGRDVPKWKFRVLSVGSYGRPEQVDESSDFDDIDEIQKWLQDGQNLIEWPATVSDIKRIFKECGGVGSSDRQQRDVEAAKNRRLIVEQPKEEWEAKQKHPKYNLNL